MHAEALCNVNLDVLNKAINFCSVQAADLSGNVEALLVAVKSTNDFEAELAQKFGAAKPAEEPQTVSLQQRICCLNDSMHVLREIKSSCTMIT